MTSMHRTRETICFVFAHANALKTGWSPVNLHIYRPHPKDGGRYCFHRHLSVHTRGFLPWPGPYRGGTYPGWVVPFPRVGTPHQGRYPPPIQISTANSCCVAGGMPLQALAFTQEDFFVVSWLTADSKTLIKPTRRLFVVLFVRSV